VIVGVGTHPQDGDESVVHVRLRGEQTAAVGWALAVPPPQSTVSNQKLPLRQQRVKFIVRETQEPPGMTLHCVATEPFHPGVAGGVLVQ
jgi:hypothetical protein